MFTSSLPVFSFWAGGCHKVHHITQAQPSLREAPSEENESLSGTEMKNSFYGSEKNDMIFSLVWLSLSLSLQMLTGCLL